jgi:hypothetical protein
MSDNSLYNITDIQHSLGFKITGEFITESLGVQPAHREKRSLFFTEDQYIEIQKKLTGWINNTELSRAEGKANKPAPAASATTSEVDDDDL